MKNEGKKFEEDFKNSVDENYFFYRFKDGTSSWDGGNARFQASNICDCMIMGDNLLSLIELKSTKGTSIPFSMIRQNQVDEMMKASVKKNVSCVFVFNFRSKEETYFIEVDFVKDYMDGKYELDYKNKSSIPLKFLQDYGWVIKQEKKRTRFKYDLCAFYV